jgi:hypothetical protein
LRGNVCLYILDEYSVPSMLLCSPVQLLLELLLENISISCCSRCSNWWPSLFIFYFIPCLIPYLHIWICLYSVTMFYKDCIQSNQQLALSQLLHSKHYTSTMFLYPAHDWRPAQETWVVCAGLHNKKYRALNIHPIYLCYNT